MDSIERLASEVRGSERFDPRLFAKPAPQFALKDRRILIVYLFDGVGHGALLAPVLAAIAAKKPKAIGVLTLDDTARLLKTVDLPIKLHPFPEALLPGQAKAREAARAKTELIESLRAKKYEIAVDLSFNEALDARPFIQGSGATTRLGWVKPKEKLDRVGLDFGAPDARDEATMHWSRALVMPLATLGIERPQPDVKFIPRTGGHEKAAALFGTDERAARVLIVPGASRGQPGDVRFAAVGRWAQDRRGARVVVAGSPKEAALVREVKKAIGGEAGSFTAKDLGLLREVILASDVVVTNDTGPMHLSFLLGKPTIATFRQASPVVFGPPKNDPDFVVVNAHRELEAPRDSNGDDVWARLVIHHLDRLLARRARRKR